MSIITRVIVVAFGVVFLAGSDLAAQTPERRAGGKRSVREMDFEGDVVEAQFLRPDQSVAEALIRHKKSSLIQERTDFVDEILKSAEDL